MAWKALFLIIFSTFLVVACSSSAAPDAPVDSSSSTGASDSSNTTAEKPEPAVASKYKSDLPQGGKLIRLYRDPPTLDPHLTTDNISGGLVNEIFGGLVTLGLDLKVAPDLAERWDISDDGRVYTFYLRKDAKLTAMSLGDSICAEV